MRAETAAFQRAICAAQDALAVNEPAKSMPAIELGAKDEGPAGPRGGGFHAGYFRDPEGNKLTKVTRRSRPRP